MSEYIEWTYDDLPECIKDMPRMLSALECIDPSDARDTWGCNCKGNSPAFHYRMLRWKYEQAYQYFDKDFGYIVWPVGTLPEQFRDSKKAIAGLEGKAIVGAWSSGMMGSSSTTMHYRMLPEDYERLAVEPVAVKAIEEKSSEPKLVFAVYMSDSEGYEIRVPKGGEIEFMKEAMRFSESVQRASKSAMDHFTRELCELIE